MEPDSSTIEFNFNGQKYFVSLEQVSEIAQKVQDLLGVGHFELSLDFVDELEMQRLNSEYRQKDYSTDVLSFSQQDWTCPLTLENPFVSHYQSEIPQVLGDLVISLINADRNAKEINQGLDRELCFLLIHGILHLCGHDHSTAQEESIMFEQQKMILTKLQGDPPIWENCVRSES